MKRKDIASNCRIVPEQQEKSDDEREQSVHRKQVQVAIFSLLKKEKRIVSMGYFDPISLAGPDQADLTKSRALEAFLKQQGQ